MKVPSLSHLKAMGLTIQKVIEEEQPDMVIFEDVALQTNAKVLVLLAQLQGMIIQICSQQDIKYAIYKPTTWRKELGFTQGNKVKRPELKRQAIQYVVDNFPAFVMEIQEDTVEAICIGAAYLKSMYVEGYLDVNY